MAPAGRFRALGVLLGRPRGFAVATRHAVSPHRFSLSIPARSWWGSVGTPGAPLGGQEGHLLARDPLLSAPRRWVGGRAKDVSCLASGMQPLRVWGGAAFEPWLSSEVALEGGFLQGPRPHSPGGARKARVRPLGAGSEPIPGFSRPLNRQESPTSRRPRLRSSGASVPQPPGSARGSARGVRLTSRARACDRCAASSPGSGPDALGPRPRNERPRRCARESSWRCSRPRSVQQRPRLLSGRAGTSPSGPASEGPHTLRRPSRSPPRARIPFEGQLARLRAVRLATDARSHLHALHEKWPAPPKRGRAAAVQGRDGGAEE
jgi:hypothetical protein